MYAPTARAGNAGGNPGSCHRSAVTDQRPRHEHTGDDIEAFCRAALAAEAADLSSEDSAVVQPAYDNLEASAPSSIRDAIDNCGFALTVTATEYAFGGLPDHLDA